MQSKPRRSIFFNLAKIRMPVGALTSIAHRASGILLACGLPFSVYLLDYSLRGPQSFARIVHMTASPAFRVAALITVWALAHHLLAGIRHMLSDVDVGSALPAGRRSAWLVNLAGAGVALLAACVLL